MSSWFINQQQLVYQPTADIQSHSIEILTLPSDMDIWDLDEMPPFEIVEDGGRARVKREKAVKEKVRWSPWIQHSYEYLYGPVTLDASVYFQLGA